MAAARNFTARQSILQIHGTCEACRTGRTPAVEGGTTELLFARDALRIAIATERSGLEFYSRGARMTKDARGRRVFEKLAEEEKEHLGKLEARYKELLHTDPLLESRRRSCFQGRRMDCSRPAPSSWPRGSTISQALMIGIRCERALSPLLSSVTATLRGLGREADIPRFAPRRRAPRV